MNMENYQKCILMPNLTGSVCPLFSKLGAIQQPLVAAITSHWPAQIGCCPCLNVQQKENALVQKRMTKNGKHCVIQLLTTLEVELSWIALPLRGLPRCQEGTNGEESMLKRMLLPFVPI